MTEQLLKELQDSGFSWEVGGDSNYWKPSLSELIEACEEPFALYIHGGRWVAVNGDPVNTEWENFVLHGHEGSTPEEAVAKLWLALHQS